MSGLVEMLSAEPTLQDAGREEHLVQFYEADNAALIRNAAAFIAAGLRSGCSAVTIATDQHTPLIAAELEADGIPRSDLEARGKLVMLDAATTLRRFLINGYPDPERFDRVVGDLVRHMVDEAGSNGIVAYGEMVGLLWEQRQFPAAIRLEQLWNKVRERTPFRLFCWYPVDIFSSDFDPGVVDALLCAHSHILPRDVHGQLDRALNRALAEALGAEEAARVTQAAAQARTSRLWGRMPPPESLILWLRRNLPEDAGRILSLAREYYVAGRM